MAGSGQGCPNTMGFPPATSGMPANEDSVAVLLR